MSKFSFTNGSLLNNKLEFLNFVACLILVSYKPVSYKNVYPDFFVAHCFFVCVFCKINIVVALQALFNISKLAGSIQNACAGDARLCERRILCSPHFVPTTV